MEYNDFLLSITDSCSTKDKVLANTLGVMNREICKNVVISPGWKPERIFNMDGAEIIAESTPLFGFEIWNIYLESSCITYVKTGYGAPMVLDAMLLLGLTQCRNALFLSSVGALSEQIKVGDIIIPEYALCGDGASRYIRGEYLSDVFGEKVYPHKKSFDRLIEISEDCCARNNVKYHVGRTFCTDTIMAQYRYVGSIMKTGCNSVDMETAAFFAAAKMIGISAVSLMQVSDNTVADKSLLSNDIDEKERDYRRYARKTAVAEIVKKYFSHLF